MKKYIVEFIGTFFLVFTIGMTVVDTPEGVLPPVAIGLVLMVMVYAGGHISGAHYNPAITLAVWLRGRCPAKDIVPYIVAQIAAAAAAVGSVALFKGEFEAPAATANGDPALGAIFIAEFLFTFALAYVVLNSATSKHTDGNSFYGLAIGGVVTAGAFTVGSISGAVFNPAVLAGAVLMKLIPASSIAVYLGAIFAGATAAALVFKLLNCDDK